MVVLCCFWFVFFFLFSCSLPDNVSGFAIVSGSLPLHPGNTKASRVNIKHMFAQVLWQF